SGVTGGEHRPLDAGQVQPGDLFGGQDTVVLVGCRGRAPVGACQGQPGQEQRVLADSRLRLPWSLRGETSSYRRRVERRREAPEEKPVRGNVQDPAPRGPLFEPGFTSAAAGEYLRRLPVR